jgi:hypothetical protein
MLCDACTVTGPVPVTVRVLPLTEAFPLVLMME